MACNLIGKAKDEKRQNKCEKKRGKKTCFKIRQFFLMTFYHRCIRIFCDRSNFLRNSCLDTGSINSKANAINREDQLVHTKQAGTDRIRKIDTIDKSDQSRDKPGNR